MDKFPGKDKVPNHMSRGTWIGVQLMKTALDVYDFIRYLPYVGKRRLDKDPKKDEE